MKSTAISLFQYFQRSIYRKMLISFFLVSALTVTILVTDFYMRTAPDLRLQAVEASERLTQQSAATLNAYFNNVRSFSWNYFGDSDFQQFVFRMGSDPNALSTYQGKFTQFVYDNPIVSSVIVWQFDGFSMRSGNSTVETPPFERNKLVETAIRANGKGVWVPSKAYDIQAKQGVRTLTFVQAVRRISLDSPGPIIGIMTYDLSQTALKDWLRDVEGGGENRIYIMDSSNGSIVFSLDDDEYGRELLTREQLLAMKQAGDNHFYAKDERVSNLIVYNKLSNTDWMLVSSSPTQSLIEPVRQFTKRTVIIGSISLLVSMALASVFSSRIITPLKELSKGMKAIEVGNYSVTLPLRSQDEVGYLSASFNRMAREINRLIMKVYETELVKKNAEIKSLQSQINPHFLYNTLGIIDSLSSMEGDGRVSYISRSLAKMFRYNISGDDTTTLEAEFQQIRLYLSIQKIRFDDRLDYSIYLEPGIEKIRIPKMLFQPLVENSIVHGISRSIAGGTVRVEAIRADGGDVQIQVWNNGSPIEDERQIWLGRLLRDRTRTGEAEDGRASIGLLNVMSRIKLLYGDQYGIAFESGKELGTMFTISIPSTLPQGGRGA